ncbi:MAG: universal stress protein [Chloroflexota bacterium]
MFKRIEVPIDGSSTSLLALEKAAELAKEQHAAVRVIQVVDLGPLYRAAFSGINISDIEQMIIQDAETDLANAAAIARRDGVSVETALIRGNERRISQAIVEDANHWGADLIVVGSHGRHGLERLVLGSVAEGIARAATVPVLIVRGN